MKDIHETIKLTSGKNLEIPHHINPVSSVCVDFLHKILEHDIDKRMSWKEFFDHPIHKVDENLVKSGFYNPLGSTSLESKEIHDRFETCKEALPVFDSDLKIIKEDSLEDSIFVKDNSYADKIGKNIFAKLATKIYKDKKDVENISGAYLHEKNKAKYVKEVALSVNLTSKCFYSSYNSHMIAIILLKKAKVYLDTYKHVLCVTKVNVFKYEKFDQWLTSEDYLRVVREFKNESDVLNQEWYVLQAEVKKIQERGRKIEASNKVWSPIDKQIILNIDSTNPIEFEEFNKNINEKLQNMKDEYKGLLHTVDYKIRKGMMLTIIMISIAQKVKEIEYHNSEEFDWRSLTVCYQGMSIKDLEEVIDSIDE